MKLIKKATSEITNQPKPTPQEPTEKQVKAEAVERLALRPSLVQIIEEAQDAAEKKKAGWFMRVSALWGCSRANFFHWKGQQQEETRASKKLLRVLSNGEAVHRIIQEYLANHTEYWFAAEHKVSLDLRDKLGEVLYDFYGDTGRKYLRINGSCDGVLIRKKDREVIGIEIKSMNSASFGKLKEPYDYHINQAWTYATLMGVDKMIILYWNKDNQELKEFYTEVSPDFKTDLANRIRYLKSRFGEKDVPFRAAECDPGLCPYVLFCGITGGTPLGDRQMSNEERLISDEEQLAPSEKKIGELTVKEFFGLLSDSVQFQRYIVAAKEMELTNQIIQDLGILRANASAPFRVSSPEEAAKLAAMFQKYFVENGDGEILVILAYRRKQKN